MAKNIEMTVADVYNIIEKLNIETVNNQVSIFNEEKTRIYSILAFRNIPHILSKCKVIAWGFNSIDGIAIYINSDDEYWVRWLRL